MDVGGNWQHGPRTVRWPGASDTDPCLGGQRGTTFMPRRSRRVLVGAFACPVSSGVRVDWDPGWRRLRPAL
jgi:hypothetical protein